MARADKQGGLPGEQSPKSPGPPKGQRRGSTVGRLGLSAGRLVMRPTRAVAGEMLEPAAEAAVDRAFAGPLPEVIARSLVEHHVIERVVREVLSSAAFDAAVDAALQGDSGEGLVERVLASPRTERILGEAIESKLTAQLADRMLQSPEFEEILKRTMSSPAVRNAIAEQTMTIGDEMIASAREATIDLDTKLERAPRRLVRKQAREPVASGVPSAPNGGFATRGVALTIDAALAQLVYLIGAAMAALIASLAGGIHPGWVAVTLAGAGWVIVQVAYFAGSWAASGRTLGMHLLGLRVRGPDGRKPGLLRSLVRLVGLWLAITLAFLGFLPALIDDRRRALQDFLSGTEVVYDERTTAGGGRAASHDPAALLDES